MRREYRYEDYKNENRDRFREAWFRWQAELQPDARRVVRRRPRDPHEIALLDKLAYDNWHGAFKRGDLRQLGPRRYRLRVDGLPDGYNESSND